MGGLRAPEGLMLLFSLLEAQTILLVGRVESMEGEPLSYALVRLPQSGFQILTRGDGSFQLNLSEGQTIVEIRYLGFSPHQETLWVSPPGPIRRTFRLRRQDIRLPSVIITEGNANPADILIRRAIQRKQANRACLPPYRTETYTLFTIRLPEGLNLSGIGKILKKQVEDDTVLKGDILYMSEALSEVDFKPPDKYKETIRYSRVVGTRQYGFIGSWVLQDFDPYQERLSIPELTKASLVLPLANDALLYYRYRLIGETWDNDGFLYKIAFEPKNPQIGVKGYLLLADESYALRGIEGMITQEQGSQFVDTLYLRMQYAPVGFCWAPAEIQMRARLKLEFLGQKLSLLGEGQFLYRRYAILQEQKPKPASRSRKALPVLSTTPKDTVSGFFRLDTVKVERLDFSERLRILEGAERPENAFWDSLRKVPLDTMQQAYIQRGDSLLKAADTAAMKAKPRRSFSFRREGLNFSLGKGQEMRSWNMGLIVGWPGYTALEGWVLRGGVSYEGRAQGSLWEATLRLRYGLGWRRLLPEGGFLYRRNPFPPFSLEVWGGWEAREGPDFIQVPLLENTLFYLLQNKAPLQVYDRFYVRGRWSTRWHRSWQSAVALTYDRRPSTPTREGYYPAYRLSFFTEWSPGTQLYRTPRNSVFIPPQGPFQITLRTGQEVARLPDRYLWTGFWGMEPTLSISPWGRWRWGHSFTIQSGSAPWADRLFPNVEPFPIHQYYTDCFFWPLYRPAGRYSYQTQAHWELERALLRYVPLLRKTDWQEHVSFRALYTEARWHAEISFWLTRIALALGRWRTGLNLSVGAHYALWGYNAGLWRISFGLGAPEFRSSAQKRFTE